MRARKPVEPAEPPAHDDTLRFQQLVDNGQDLFYRYRVSPMSVEYVSTAALTITGRDPQEFYNDPQLALTIVHPDDRGLLAGSMAALGDPDPSKLRRTLLLRWIHRDGRVVWAEHQRVPIFDRAGRWIAVEGVARDVTERVEATRRLADSESLLRLLAENARDMIYRCALVPHGLQYVSPASTRLTGRTPEEFLADPEAAWSAVHPEDRVKARAMRTHPEASVDPVVLRWVHPDGSVVCVEHRNSLVYDATGQLIAFEGIGRDITELLAIQNRLRESESQLRRLAASLNSARETERADVSRELHDELGQTLTGLKLEMTRTVRDLMRRGLEHQMIDRMQSMVGSIEVATETVRRLASTLRPPALDHLGLGAAIELEAAAIARRTGVRCRIAGSVGEASLTSEQSTAVFRIVQEALTNVVRHANASAVKISMRQTTRSTSLTIADNGRGINPRALADPISIGLLGMRERAQLIGAKLSISARPGKGTAVVVTVPAGAGRSRE
jgi:two-component system, NarL family, sensor histidine kinase UhpB